MFGEKKKVRVYGTVRYSQHKKGKIKNDGSHPHFVVRQEVHNVGVPCRGGALSFPLSPRRRSTEV